MQRVELQDEQQDLPVTGLVTRSIDGVEAAFMSLALSNEVAPPDEVHARWIIERPGSQSPRVPGPASQRLLDWREGDIDYQVRAVFLDELPRNLDLQEQLELLTRTTGRQGGELSLADGTPAIWLIGTAADTGKLELDIAWDCEDTLVSRFALNAQLPNSEQGDRHQALLDRVANRINCT